MRLPPSSVWLERPTVNVNYSALTIGRSRVQSSRGQYLLHEIAWGVFIVFWQVVLTRMFLPWEVFIVRAPRVGQPSTSENGTGEWDEGLATCFPCN